MSSDLSKLIALSFSLGIFSCLIVYKLVLVIFAQEISAAGLGSLVLQSLSAGIIVILLKRLHGKVSSGQGTAG